MMQTHRITDITAWEVLDSRGNPTLQAQVVVDDIYTGSAMVPSGASTGAFEAVELRDQGQTRYGGAGVLTAIGHVNGKIRDALIGMPVMEQRALDYAMIALDGTENKGKLGANAILGVSLAAARAAAAALSMPLYRYLGGVGSHVLPVPMMNIINGGRHAGNNLSIQEFMIMPVGAESFSEALRWCSEVYHALRDLLRQGGYTTAVGDEGGFAPDFREDREAIEFILRAIGQAGFDCQKQFQLSLDPAATEMYDAAKELGHEDSYCLFKTGDILTQEQMIQMWADLKREFPILSIEDPLAEEDWVGYQKLSERLGKQVQLVGDDLFVTNKARLKKGITLGVCNAILIKVNQIGTLTEAIESVQMAQRCGYGAIISHRSGETEDTFIADLAVAMGTGQIKIGAPCRSERVAKYNRLLTIERELGTTGRYGLPELQRFY